MSLLNSFLGFFINCVAHIFANYYELLDKFPFSVLRIINEKIEDSLIDLK